MKPSTVTELLFNQLNFRAEKQKVISTNIANIDTPDYKTKDLKFKGELERAKQEQELSLRVTHKNHIPVDNNLNNSKNYSMYEVQGLEEQNDGNNVNLDTQMSQQAQNSVMFSALQNSIKKDSLWFKNVVDASSKN